MIFYFLVIAVHVVACFILIAVILLQAGRGGGLSDSFGGDSSQTIFGTKASVFLTRSTVIAASLFLVTCLLLGIMTSIRGRSLINLKEQKGFPAGVPYQIPQEPQQNEGTGGKVVDTEAIPAAEPEKTP